MYSASRCNNPTYLCGPSKYPILTEAVYRAQNGKLHKLRRTYFHGTVFAPRKYLYQKEANDMEKPEMYSTSRCNNPHFLVRAVKIPRLEEGSIGPRTESWVNWYGHMAMVPCLDQGITYTKRKLRVWRNQKCIPLVGAITPLTCAGRQSTRSQVRQYRAQNPKLGKLGWTYCHDTVFPPGNIYTKRKLRVWRTQKCIPLVGEITPLNCAGRQNTRSRGRQYRAQNGKLSKWGRTFCHGTVFSPRKYLHQKEATGMERPEIYSASRCNNPTYLCGPSKYHVWREAV